MQILHTNTEHILSKPADQDLLHNTCLQSRDGYKLCVYWLSWAGCAVSATIQDYLGLLKPMAYWFGEVLEALHQG